MATASSAGCVPRAMVPTLSIKAGAGDMAGEFSRVSEDMNELVFHLDTIQNDISELAGRPISVYDNNS